MALFFYQFTPLYGHNHKFEIKAASLLEKSANNRFKFTITQYSADQHIKKAPTNPAKTGVIGTYKFEIKAASLLEKSANNRFKFTITQYSADQHIKKAPTNPAKTGVIGTF